MALPNILQTTNKQFPYFKTKFDRSSVVFIAETRDQKLMVGGPGPTTPKINSSQRQHRVHAHFFLFLSAFIQRYSLLSRRLTALMSYVILTERLSPFIARFWISIQVVCLQRYLVVTWLVPRETAAVLGSPYNYALVYSVTSFQVTYLGCMRV